MANTVSVRKLSAAQELLESRKIGTIAFLGSSDMEKTARDIENDVAQQAALGAQAPQKTDRWGAFDEDGHMISTMSNHLYQVEYDGSRVMAGAVGGVASLPEYRSKGGIRSIFSAQFNEMYDNGFVFSYLFPFSNEYYRQFGYEFSCAVPAYRFPTEDLKRFSCSWNVEMCAGGEKMEEFGRAYEKFIAGCNLALHRKPWQWRNHDADPYKDREYRYLLTDETGEPRAYVVFIPNEPNGRDERELQVKDIAFDSPAAFSQLLGFLYRLRGNCKYIKMELPAYVPLREMLPEQHHCSAYSGYHGQVRVVNVMAALMLMRHPAGKGSYAVYVQDDFLPRNTGTYTVSYQDGAAAQVTFSPQKEDPDLCVSLQRFTQLCLGYLTPGAMAYFTDAQVLKNAAELEKVFVSKNVFFLDHF